MQMGVHHRRRHHTGIRWRPREAMEGHAGERVLIGLRILRATLDLLGGRVVECPYEAPGLRESRRRAEALGETEVRQVRVLPLEQDVAGFTSRWISP